MSAPVRHGSHSAASLARRVRGFLVWPTSGRLALLALVVLVGVGATMSLLEPTDPVLDAYVTTFAPGEGGWAQYRSLALESGAGSDRLLSIKALVLNIDSPAPEVFFIPNRGDPLHYDFAHRVLRLRARAFTRSTFDWATYAAPDRTQVATTVDWYPGRSAPSERYGDVEGPVVLRFAPQDHASVREIGVAYTVTREHMPMLAAEQLFFVPSSAAQEVQAEAAAASLEAEGVAWLPGDALDASVTFQALNPGVAYGLLRAVDVDDLMGAEVGTRDILVLDRLPLDLPPVAGTLTDELQTPLAHVNVLARARGTPNMALHGAREDPRVAPHLDSLVRLEVGADDFRIAAATADEVEGFWAERRAEPRAVPAADLSVVGVHDLDAIRFVDATAFGAKAANLAELHRLLPDVAPGGLAVPFSAYADHLQRNRVDPEDCPVLRGACRADLEPAACDAAATVCVEFATAHGAPTLAAYIRALSARADFAADSVLRAALLHGVRMAIEEGEIDPSFAAEIERATAAEFGHAPFRLRSSTNAEDLEGFSGAGLYESVSAYAGGDDKPVAERIRRVWASVWGWRAFEERALWGVPHDKVYMGVLVNRAFPEEQANGVLVTTNLADPDRGGLYVNAQAGETSVTNPTGEALPEILVLQPGPGGWHAERLQRSSLAGDDDLLTPDEIRALGDAASRAAEHFSPLYGARKGEMAFEMEFKIHDAERRLYIKQIRPYTTEANPQSP